MFFPPFHKGLDPKWREEIVIESAKPTDRLVATLGASMNSYIMPNSTVDIVNPELSHSANS